MGDDYEARLREALAQAEAADSEATARYVANDDQPNSYASKSLKADMSVRQGQVMGLTTALNLLTGEHRDPNVALTRERVEDEEP